MGSKKSVNVTVLVDESHRQDMLKVARNLERKGFVLRESLNQIGVLSGSVAKTGISGLRAR